jgi:hypothetical protein
MEPDATGAILSHVGAALAALSALSTAAFGLLDSSKALWGGVSNIGLKHLQDALRPFDSALEAAVGDGWKDIVRANWINGLPKADQKAVVGSLLKLGLTETTAEAIAKGGHVEPEALKAAAAKMAAGKPLTDRDLNVVGRMVASVEAQLDAAFERAEQQYRNVSRVLAGLVAVGLAIAAQQIWVASHAPNPPSLALAIGIGLLAVPVAPVAKDLTSALSSAMRALKAAKAV